MDFITRLFKQPSVPQIDAAGLKARQNEVFVLDVRQPEEYRQGHIAGAKLIPLGELGQRMKELPQGREIVCVCHSGNRSRSATRQLTQAGFQATNLTGGMIGWNRAGLPVRKG